MSMSRDIFVVFFVLALLTLPVGGISSVARADEFTSTNFTITAPTISSGGYATSTSFTLQSIVSPFAVGTSSITSFGLNPGFLFYPFVSTPVVTATAGDAQVALSWTAASGVLGWTVGGYDVGQSTASGGPYSYSSVGNVTSSTRTGLTNDTTYYFVVVPKDALGNRIATSTQVSGTPVASSPSPSPSPSPSGGGGATGGGGAPAPSSSGASVFFTGRAYPRSTITLLKDAGVAATTIAGSDASFSITLSGLSGGSYIFSVYGEDKDGNRSSLLTFPVTVTAGANSNVGGIFIAPSIAVDKSEVKRGDAIAFFGQSVPSSDILISVNSEEEFFARTVADNDGVYFHNFDTSFLELGAHSSKSRSSIGNIETSSFGRAATFIVGTKNVAAVATKKGLRGDMNGDGKVNLVDFSIAAYWYKRTLSGDIVAKETANLNGDGKIDLVDFSIMAFNWTG